MGSWENHPNIDEIIQSKCSHLWKNDEMFENGCVTMITNDGHPLGEEMRQVCSQCGKVRYTTKEADG